MRPQPLLVVNRETTNDSLTEIWTRIEEKERSVNELDESGKSNQVGLVIITSGHSKLNPNYRILSPGILGRWAKENPDKVHHDEPSDTDKFNRFMQLFRELEQKSKTKSPKSDKKININEDDHTTSERSRSRYNKDYDKSPTQVTRVKKKKKKNQILDSSSEDSSDCQIIGTTPKPSSFHGVISSSSNSNDSVPAKPVARRKTTAKKRVLESPSPKLSELTRPTTSKKKKADQFDGSLSSDLGVDLLPSHLIDPPSTELAADGCISHEDSNGYNNNPTERPYSSNQQVSPGTHERSPESSEIDIGGPEDYVTCLDAGKSVQIGDTLLSDKDGLLNNHTNAENKPPTPKKNDPPVTVEIHVDHDEFAELMDGDDDDDEFFKPKMSINKLNKQPVEVKPIHRPLPANNTNMPSTSVQDHKPINTNNTNGFKLINNELTRPEDKKPPAVKKQLPTPEHGCRPNPIERKPDWNDTLKKFADDQLHIVYKDLNHFKSFIKDEPRVKDLPKELMFKYFAKDETMYLEDLMILICELSIYQTDSEFWSGLIGRFKRKLTQLSQNIPYKSSTNPQTIHTKYLNAMLKLTDHAKKTNLAVTITYHDMVFLHHPTEYLNVEKRDSLNIMLGVTCEPMQPQNSLKQPSHLGLNPQISTQQPPSPTPQVLPQQKSQSHQQIPLKQHQQQNSIDRKVQIVSKNIREKLEFVITAAPR